MNKLYKILLASKHLWTVIDIIFVIIFARHSRNFTEYPFDEVTLVFHRTASVCTCACVRVWQLSLHEPTEGTVHGVVYNDRIWYGDPKNTQTTCTCLVGPVWGHRKYFAQERWGGGHPFVPDDSFKRVSGVCSQSRNVDASCDPWVRLRFDSYTHFHSFCAFVETRTLSPTMTNTDVTAEWWKTKFTASYVVHKWNCGSLARRWSTNSSYVFIKISFASEFVKGIYIHPGQVLHNVWADLNRISQPPGHRMFAWYVR
jgi:hypothetical protein